MIASKEKKGAFNRGPSDVVGVDIASSGVKLVRMKRTKDGLTVTHAELLPPVAVAGRSDEGTDDRISFSKAMRARSAALTYTAESAVIRLLSLPGFSFSLVGSIRKSIVAPVPFSCFHRWRVMLPASFLSGTKCAPRSRLVSSL